MPERDDALPPSWRDHEDHPVTVPPPPGADDEPFYVAIGDFQGEEYRRNAFAQGTVEEVAALRGHLHLSAGDRLLDVGCGDGRHLRALAAGGVAGLGVDVSPGLVAAARAQASAAGLTGCSFVVGDARRLGEVVTADRFDAATSVCQGGFGTSPATDPAVLRGLAERVRPGGRVAFTAFHALFAARHLAPGDAYDTVHGVHHQRSEVRGPDHAVRNFDLWTTAYTVGEAVALARSAGLVVSDVVGVEPGRYGGQGVALDDPELLVVGTVPG